MLWMKIRKFITDNPGVNIDKIFEQFPNNPQEEIQGSIRFLERHYYITSIGFNFYADEHTKFKQQFRARMPIVITRDIKTEILEEIKKNPEGISAATLANKVKCTSDRLRCIGKKLAFENLISIEMRPNFATGRLEHCYLPKNQ
jgi:hypothetical protein